MQLRAVPGAHRAFGPRSAVRHRLCRTPRGRRTQGGRHATARSRSSVSATGPRRNETIRSWSTLRVAPNPNGSASSLKKSSGRMAMTLARDVPRPRSLRLYGNRERHGRRLRFCARGAAAFEASALAECSSADVARSDDWFRRAPIVLTAKPRVIGSDGQRHPHGCPGRVAGWLAGWPLGW